MRIVAHTKYGVFYGIEKDYDESNYRNLGKFLEKLGSMDYFSFGTDDGEIYLTKAMIDDSLFILEKWWLNLNDVMIVSTLLNVKVKNCGNVGIIHPCQTIKFMDKHMIIGDM